MYRLLRNDEIQQLLDQGCTADDWKEVEVKDRFTPEHIKDAHFSGHIRLGVYEEEFILPGGVHVHSGICHARIHNTEIGDNVRIWNVHNYIANYRIGDHSCVENINTLLVDGRSSFGNGVRVAVMNEGGGREIPIFDHLSAHLAYILTLYRHRPKLIRTVERIVDDYANQQSSEMGEIGQHVCIANCGSIKNVRIGDYALVLGTSRLKNGSINSNKEAPVKMGSGVKCTDFIISSGSKVLDSTLLDRCFVGQGCIFDKHYSAGESLFFSNCQGMHGEAAAIFAGPYCVTHHKSTLLIAGMFSFLNAGSGSNQSNHMYKLGPIHQGLAERGSKTTSDSYLLWPSRIGAFSLVMGRHTHHADTSEFPFSYLIENNSQSYIVPGANLRTVGTIRDAQKWPQRDLRTDSHKLDMINYNLLSPYIVDKMWNGRETLSRILHMGGENTEEFGYRNCIIRNSSVKHGIGLYSLGIQKFLGNSLISRLMNHPQGTLAERLRPDSEIGLGKWSDMAGLIAPKTEIQRLMDETEKGRLTLMQIQQRFEEMHAHYYSYEWTWALERLERIWGCKYQEVSREKIIETIHQWLDAVVKLDNMVREDARKEFDLNSQTGFGVDGDIRQQQADFRSVRGSFEDNPFVHTIGQHIARKTALAHEVLATL